MDVPVAAGGESPDVCIRLFGDLDLRQGGGDSPQPLESARTESLLAYLILHRGAPVSRERLAFLLWPESAEAQARTNLRHVLHNLRRALPDPDRFLNVTQRTLQWRADAPCWIDVAVFEEALSVGDGEALAQAVGVYTGDLLEGNYDEWLLAERDRFRQLYLGALERLAALSEASGDHTAAIDYARRLLAQDPLHEGTYRQLIRLYDARGDRGRALRTYHACVAALENELGVAPSTATRQVYEALLAEEPGEATQTRSGRPGGPPLVASRLVGRAAERSQLAALWGAAERGRAQLVLVTGEPGIGKSRLIEDFRAWCVHRGAATAVARSYPEEGVLAYGPIVTWLRSQTLQQRLVRVDQARQSELARLLPELLDARPELPPPPPLPESDQRQRLFDAVAETIVSPGTPTRNTYAGAASPAVILQANWFMSNLLASAEAVAHTGKLFAPAGGGKISMIDPRDIAAVAAITLTTGGNQGRTYVLTGGEAITYDDVARELSAATARPVDFVDIPDEAARQAFLQMGMPDWLVTHLIGAFAIIRQGGFEQTTTAVQALTGRPPRTFAAFARDTAAAFTL